jgi:hypothetical protein
MEYGVSAQGRQELLKFLGGKKLTKGEAIQAKCYDCMSRFRDGKVDCKIKTCPLYEFMPYSAAYKNRIKKELSPEQKQVMADRLQEARKNKVKKG